MFGSSRRASAACSFTTGYAAPVIYEAGGVRQLIIWHPLAVSSLDPETGEVYWEQPFEVGYDMTVTTPVRRGSDLFVTTFYDGPMMLRLDNDSPGAELRWRGSSHSEILGSTVSDCPPDCYFRILNSVGLHRSSRARDN